MIIGDLNEIVGPSKRRGGAGHWDQSNFPLQDRLHDCELIDLEFKGPRFTWFRRDSRFGILQQRLNRSVANDRWRCAFPEAYVIHLPRTHSDHCPLVMLTKGVARIRRFRPFRWEAMWFEEIDYRELTVSTIEENYLSLKWNRSRSGNLF